jgi:hypothetical protein
MSPKKNLQNELNMMSQHHEYWIFSMFLNKIAKDDRERYKVK